MSHYTLSWHDQQNNHHEIGEYANAIKQAREDLPNMKASPLSCKKCKMKDVAMTNRLMQHEHPFCLESIKREDE